MATQTNEQKLTGRNRGTRKGSELPKDDPKLNIGSGMTPKDQTPAVVLTAQADPASVEGLKIDRKTLDQAVKIIGGFHKANDELQTLKSDVEAKRGGLSDICFQLAKLGAGAADKPEHRLAACVKVFDSAEAYERSRWQKAHKLADLPTAKEALGSSWQTYKSQILKCVKAGLNPGDFANGTVYREAMSQTGNKARKPRQTAGQEAAGVTVADAFDTMTKGMRPELAAAFKVTMEECAKLPEDKQMDFANRIHRIAVAASKLTKTAEAPKEEEGTEEARATGTM